MQAWPRNAALTLLLIALALLAVFQWLPALLLFPAAGALLVWNQAPPTGQRHSEY